MYTSDLAREMQMDQTDLEDFIKNNGIKYKSRLGAMFVENPDELKKIFNEQKQAEEQEEKEYFEKTKDMLITSGFNFDGYKITKYSGYISGDAVTQVDRGTATSLKLFGVNLGTYGGTNTGTALENSLALIRQKAISELKMKAYDLGCNAVIGIDFDYITLEPETASSTGGTVYMPYVFCVTANGNAVVIEKIN